MTAPAGPTMLIGDVRFLHQSEPPRSDEIITLVTLPPSAVAQPCNTLLVTCADIGTLGVRTRTVDGTRHRSYRANGGELFDGIGLGRTAIRYIEDLAGTGAAASHTPLFCTTTMPSGGRHTFSRIHLRPDRICFIRTSTTPIPDDPSGLAGLTAASQLHAEHAMTLNSHECAVRDAFEGHEVEAKFTLPPATPIWHLTTDIHARIAAGELPGMIPRLRDDLELWQYTNHLFDVHGPGDNTGYAAFMSITPGQYRIKRKNYRHDALIRPETVSGILKINSPLDVYVQDVLRLNALPLPPFQRVRYDIQFESLSTGHQYGIYLDTCTLLDDPNETLSQCEIEYLRSRTLLPLDTTRILAELDTVTAWTADILTQHGITTPSGYYSKLSFLRDVVNRRPEIRPIPPIHGTGTTP